MIFEFDCLNCEAPNLPCEVVVEDYGYPPSGMSGPPENYDPGSDIVWHVVAVVKCPDCGHLHEPELIGDTYAQAIEQKLNDQLPDDGYRD